MVAVAIEWPLGGLNKTVAAKTFDKACRSLFVRKLENCGELGCRKEGMVPQPIDCPLLIGATEQSDGGELVGARTRPGCSPASLTT